MTKSNLKNILTAVRDIINRSSEAAIRKADNAQAVAETAQVTGEKVYEFVDSRLKENGVILKSLTALRPAARTTMTFFVSSSVSTATKPKKGRMNDD